MKKASRSAAILLAALIALSVPHAEGQQPNVIGSPLPAFLPIGSTNAMLDWIVSNRPCSASFKLTFASTTNPSESYVAFPFGTVQFPSFASFEACMASNCWFLYTNYLIERTNIISAIGLIATMTSSGTLNDGLVILTNNIGLWGQITSNSFTNLTAAAFNRIRPSMLVPGLAQFSVASAGPSYAYTWPVGAQSQVTDPFPPEWTTNGVVILNDWYGYGTNDVRFTIVAGGQTNIYTGLGIAMSGATAVLQTKQSQLMVNLTPGSDVSVRTSADPATPLASWAPLTNLSWSLATNKALIPIKMDQLRMFYSVSNQSIIH